MSLQRSLPDLPSRYRGPAFRAIETVLKEDPVLAAHVRSWRSRQGQSGDTSLPVSADQLPLIALSPVPFPNTTTFSVDEVKINFAVNVEMAVPGTCFEDIVALWEAVEDAIVYAKPFRGGTVQEFLCGVIDPGRAGVWMLRAAQPAFLDVPLLRQHQEDKQITYQGGVGTLTCMIRRPA